MKWRKKECVNESKLEILFIGSYGVRFARVVKISNSFCVNHFECVSVTIYSIKFSNQKVSSKSKWDYFQILMEVGKEYKNDVQFLFLKLVEPSNTFGCDPTTMEKGLVGKDHFRSTSNAGDQLKKSTFFTVPGAKHVFGPQETKNDWGAKIGDCKGKQRFWYVEL